MYNEVYSPWNFLSNEVYFEQLKLCGCSSTYIKNDTPRFSACNNYYGHDTCRSFEPIFMELTWLVRIHTLVNPGVCENNWPNRTTDMGENVPSKPVFWLSFNQYGGFWGENFKTVLDTPFPLEKVTFIFVVQCPILWKIVMFPKIIFLGYLGKYRVFFQKNC